MLLESLACVLMVLVMALSLHALIDCAGTPAARIRYVPKLIWLLFMLSTPILGALAWTYLGKRPTPDRERHTNRIRATVSSA